jgi:hypothetical protein
MDIGALTHSNIHLSSGRCVYLLIENLVPGEAVDYFHNQKALCDLSKWLNVYPDLG